jgi:signal recognition particle receptor subunit beta
MVSLVLAGIMIAGAITFIRKYSDTPFFGNEGYIGRCL